MTQIKSGEQALWIEPIAMEPEPPDISFTISVPIHLNAIAKGGRQKAEGRR